MICLRLFLTMAVVLQCSFTMASEISDLIVGRVYKIENCSPADKIVDLKSVKIDFDKGKKLKFFLSHKSKPEDIVLSLDYYYDSDRCGRSENRFAWTKNGFYYYESSVYYGCGPNPGQPYKYFSKFGLEVSDDGAQGNYFKDGVTCKVVVE